MFDTDMDFYFERMCHGRVEIDLIRMKAMKYPIVAIITKAVFFRKQNLNNHRLSLSALSISSHDKRE
jgi:hypothetical protein